LGWPKGTPVDWSKESRGVAYLAVYLGLPAEGPPPRLSPNYVNHAISDAPATQARGNEPGDGAERGDDS
jgi:hypothetical protein